MPTAITADRIADVLLAYHKEVTTKRKVADLLQTYRNYYFTGLVEKRLQRISRHDHSFYFNYLGLTGGFNNGQWDSFYQPDSTSRANLLSQGSSKWAMHKTNMVFDRREPSYPKSNSANVIVNHIKAQETNMYHSFFKEMEQALWTLATAPNDGTSGDPIMNGIPYQCVQSTTDAVGFNGGLPSGYSTVNGHSRTTYPQLKNGTANYDSISDFVDKANSMLNLLHWSPPRTDDLVMSFGTEFEMVTTRNLFEQYQKYLSASHEAGLYPDAGKMLGGIPASSVSYKGIRWTWSDALSSQYERDQTTANPAYTSTDRAYFLKWSTWDLYGADDYFMTVDPPAKQNNPHNVVVQHMNTMLNLVCIAPWENAVIDSN
jgi:hypothetical protein